MGPDDAGDVGAPRVARRLPGLLAEYGHDPVHLDRIVQGTEVYVRDAFTELVNAGIERGDAHPSCDVEMMFDLLRAATVVRGVLAGAEDVETYGERLTTSLVAIAAVPAARPPDDTG